MTPKNITVAYELSLTQLSLSNDDIKKIFGTCSDTSIARIKKPVLRAMAERGIFIGGHRVHLATAYDVWGLNDEDLERKYAKFKKLLVCMWIVKEWSLVVFIEFGRAWTSLKRRG